MNLKAEDEYEEEKRHGFQFRLKRELDALSIPPRTQKAKLERIPQEIRNLVAFQKFPEFSFGMAGPGGCGKSCALVWLIKRYLIDEYNKTGPTKFVPGEKVGFQGISVKQAEQRTTILWLNWPSVAISMKHLAARREWDKQDSSLLAIIGRIQQDPENTLLFVDDFGMENIKGEKSYVQEQLELLIDTAYGFEVRTFWTTNKTVEELADDRLYGYRMMSRMAGLSPDVVLPKDMPDLRTSNAYA